MEGLGTNSHDSQEKVISKLLLCECLSMAQRSAGAEVLRGEFRERCGSGGDRSGRTEGEAQRDETTKEKMEMCSACERSLEFSGFLLRCNTVSPVMCGEKKCHLPSTAMLKEINERDLCFTFS